MKMDINIYLLCFNESALIPHVVKHYKKYLPSCNITIYDNESTDDSVKIAKALGCSIISWGSNNSGQLGLGNATSYSSPKHVGALTSWLSVSAGYASSFAIKTDGTIWSWGQNLSGQLGLGNTTYYSSPKQIGALTNWLAVSAGTYANRGYCLAVKTDNTLWSWGRNGYGQLGHGNTVTLSSPKQVGALTNWLIVAAGYASSFCIKTDGTLWSWGYNANGNLGLGNTTNYSSPKQVGSKTSWVAVAAGNYPGIAILLE
jgi:alpha-tubulin suppressor-like RCC1 family protein